MSQKNIIFVTCHDLGRTLGCYDRHTVNTPVLDSLAANGVLFTNHFCTAPQCSPSRATLHTGRHAHTVGMLGLAHQPFGWRLHSGEKHIAKRLMDHGYDTALWGVQHLTSTTDVATLGYAYFDSENPVTPAPDVADKAIAFLNDPQRKECPFYLEIGFFEPHRPYDWGDAEPDLSLGVETPPYLPSTPGTREEIAAAQGMIRRMDEAIGRVMNALEETGLHEDTWLIFTSDHGLAMPRAKCTLYDPGLEAALLMVWPRGGIEGGRRVDALTSHVDVTPTLLEGLGYEVPPDLHGKSFWPLLQGKPYEANECIFAEKTFHTAYEPMRCIRTPTHKLIINFEIDTMVNVPDDIRQGPTYVDMLDQLDGQRPDLELYDLQEDPGERENLAGQSEMHELEQSLKQKLEAWMRSTDDPLLEGPVASPYYHRALNSLLH